MSSMKVRRERMRWEKLLYRWMRYGGHRHSVPGEFQITGQRVHPLMMHAIAMVKRLVHWPIWKMVN